MSIGRKTDRTDRWGGRQTGRPLDRQTMEQTERQPEREKKTITQRGRQTDGQNQRSIIRQPY